MGLINALGEIGAGTAKIVGVGAVVVFGLGILLLVGVIAYAVLKSLFGSGIALLLTLFLLFLLLGIASE